MGVFCHGWLLKMLHRILQSRLCTNILTQPHRFRSGPTIDAVVKCKLTSGWITGRYPKLGASGCPIAVFIPRGFFELNTRGPYSLPLCTGRYNWSGLMKRFRFTVIFWNLDTGRILDGHSIVKINGVLVNGDWSFRQCRISSLSKWNLCWLIWRRFAKIIIINWWNCFVFEIEVLNTNVADCNHH